MYKLEPYETLVQQGFLRKCEKDDLILFGYTDKCTFDRYWNEYTRSARGIIFNKNTQEIVAKPFPKFFNLGELEETFLTNLPNESYTVQEKLDGSLGIIFHHDKKWQICTRGSFFSEQAVKGTELLTKYNMKYIPTNFTLLVEIVYPDNKIVVNYGTEEKLVLLSLYDRSTLKEKFNFLNEICVLTGMTQAKSYNYSIEQMIELKKTLPKDEEGFVVRYASGLRVKIKGDEYMTIHKMISCMSPLSFWESMVGGIVNKEYLAQLPEEFRAEFEPIVDDLEAQYEDTIIEIEEEYNKVRQCVDCTEINSECRKQVGLLLKAAKPKHASAIFPMLLKQADIVDKYIMKYIRPTGNTLRNME